MAQGWLSLSGLSLIVLDRVGTVEPQFFWLGVAIIAFSGVSLLRAVHKAAD